jgi:SPOR domain
MKIVFSFFILLFSQQVLSQSQADSGSSIVIHKDPRIDLLIKKQIELNKEVYILNARSGQGFRVMVINTKDRNKAMEIKSRMLQDFPEHKTYLIYQSPYFKVQIGNFKERAEADLLKKGISRIYPTGVVVVPAVVELKPELDEFLE